MTANSSIPLHDLPIGSIICHCLEIEEVKVLQLSKGFFMPIEYSARIDVELSKVLNFFISAVISQKKQPSFSWPISYQKDHFSRGVEICCLYEELFSGN